MFVTRPAALGTPRPVGCLLAHTWRALLRPMAFALSLAAAGCSSAPPDQPYDPLESLNREFFQFNHTLDKRAAVPAASFYHSALPEPVRVGIHNFVTNLSEPVNLANDLLQGEFTVAGDTVARFGINTTVGVVGVVDAATDYGFPDDPQDFGITLGKYGVPGGPYLVLPLLGPETPRDLVGHYADSFFVPTRYFRFSGKAWVSLGLSGLNLLDQRSRALPALRDIERTSLDYYATTRYLYLQTRENRIHNGKMVPEELPAF